jgi:hypothetical protein
MRHYCQLQGVPQSATRATPGLDLDLDLEQTGENESQETEALGKNYQYFNDLQKKLLRNYFNDLTN